jgi:5'-nucleotidase
VLENGLPMGVLLNVNVPNIPEESIKGYRITKQGKLVFKDQFEKREDPRGKFYYWMKGENVNDTNSDTDGYAIQNDFVSITPIHYQLTNEAFLKTLKSWEF